MAAGFEIPAELVASHATFFGDAGRPWLDALPEQLADHLDRWELRLDGPPWSGCIALVLPVVLAADTPAVLKLQPVNDETAGEPVALRVWGGRDAVRLLRHDPASGAMLLERLDATRTLQTVPDDLAALQVLSELLSRLCQVPAPAGLRRLADIAGGMLDQVPSALARFSDPDDRHLVGHCAGAVSDLLPEPGGQLLHWDLHYENVLGRLPGTPGAPGPDPSGAPEWVAIDPKPLAGDPGFELLAALHNRWDDVVATGDVPRAVRRRFDLMTDVVGLDRTRAAGWTLGRVLENLLWEVESGETLWLAGPDRAIARALLNHYWRG